MCTSACVSELPENVGTHLHLSVFLSVSDSGCVNVCISQCDWVCECAQVCTLTSGCVLHICLCHGVWACVFICTHPFWTHAHLPCVCLQVSVYVGTGPGCGSGVCAVAALACCQHSCGATSLVVSACISIPPS